MYFQTATVFTILLIFINSTAANVRLISVTDCEVPKDDIQKDTELKITMSGAGTVDLFLKSPHFAIDDSITFRMIGQEMIDGKWVDDGTDMEAGVCDTIRSFFPKSIDKLKKGFKVDEFCNLQPGREYEMKGFTIETDEMDPLEVSPEWHYRTLITYKKDDHFIVCRALEWKNM